MHDWVQNEVIASLVHVAEISKSSVGGKVAHLGSPSGASEQFSVEHQMVVCHQNGPSENMLLATLDWGVMP